MDNQLIKLSLDDDIDDELKNILKELNLII